MTISGASTLAPATRQKMPKAASHCQAASVGIPESKRVLELTKRKAFIDLSSEACFVSVLFCKVSWS